MNIKKYIPDNKSFNIDTDFLTSDKEIIIWIIQIKRKL